MNVIRYEHPINMINNYTLHNNNCILIGDTHNERILYNILCDITTRLLDDKNDLIVLGDSGFGFGPIASAIQNTLMWIARYNKLCVEHNINLYIIRGNHDATYPEIWNSTWSNVFLIRDCDYCVFPNGKRALLVGGGISIDRCNRKHNYDYWIDEPTNVIDNVEKCDIVFSHDCPEEFNHSTNTLDERFKWAIDKDPTLIEDCLKQRSYMSDIVRRSEAKTIFYGHFHNNIKQTIDGVFGQCVNINELFFFDAEYDYTRTQ